MTQVRSGKTAPWLDELPFVGVSRLVAEGKITKDMAHAVVSAGGLTREVRVVHRLFPNGGHWSFFLCECGRRARTLRFLDGKPMCLPCCVSRGVVSRAVWGSMADKRESRARWIGRLIERLNGPPLRLHPRGSQTIDRRRALQASLSRALLASRR